MLSSCGGKKDEAEQKKEIKSVKLESVVKDTIRVTEEFTANVEAYVKNNIAPQTPNRISRILVEVGDNVRKGQLLVTLDEANMRQTKLQLENLQAEFNRLEELYAVGGISRSQYEAQKTALEVSKTAYNNLAQNTMLRSPTNGVVTARNYDNGDMVSPQLPILTIEQIAPLKMKINVSEKHFTTIKKGNKVDVTLDVFPGEIFEGVVALTYPTVDPNSRTFEVEISLKNSNRKVRPGMYAKAKIDMGLKEFTMVPDVAVRTLPGTNDKYVFIIENGIARQRNIKIGELYGNKFVVEEGLTPEDEVVVGGILSLKDGDKVEIK